MTDVKNSNLFETLRFGSSIPGGYWGCCAGDVMQCFKSDPDTPASIQFINGDGGEPCTNREGDLMFAGPTNKDVFLARLRDGTFGCGDMPNHFFIAVLTDEQLWSAHGLKWLAILKEHGFEFIRTVSNSVYTGKKAEAQYPSENGGSNLNYVFALFRGIAWGAPDDALTPPKAWTDLPSVKPELYSNVPEELRKNFTRSQAEADFAIWERVGPAKLLTEAQVREAKAPVILAAQRTNNPQEPKEDRDQRNAAAGKKAETSLRAQPEAGTPTPIQG
jgi:hypothetical protein